MRISEIRIQNYRSFKDCSLSLSQFVCVTGENNAGKSNLLRAIDQFLTGSKLQSDDYYDPSQPIRIEITFEDVTSRDLLRVQPDHRKRIEDLLIDGRLHLVRYYERDGSSKLLCQKLMPVDSRFSDESYLDGMKGKQGTELRSYLQSVYSEYSDRFENATTQKTAKEIINQIIREFSLEQMELRDSDLPTGIPNSIKALLPESIYIPAVKDVNEEVKMKESASLGKLIGIVLNQIEGAAELEEIRRAFDNLNSLLNRIEEKDGTISDSRRLSQVKDIETKVQSYVRENFPTVNLELVVPPPALKQVFSNAQITIDDGVKTTVDMKGDGLKRSVAFALIRSYVDLRQKLGTEQTTEPCYLFLFEEPELFLHPGAQGILFDALRRLAKVHQVITTTHSPSFFSPDSTGAFIKMSKIYPTEGKPYSEAVVIDLLKNLEARDAFQLICYENNAAAFFARRVVLVEGDSDLCYFKHVARVLNPEWDFSLKNIPLIRMNGKGNAKRYIEYFKKFGLEVHAILDLDALLTEKLSDDETIIRSRASLFQFIDACIGTAACEPILSGEKIKDNTIKKWSWKERYKKLKQYANEILNGNYSVIDEEACQEIKSLFTWESEDVRKQILFSGSNPNVSSARDDLLSRLRNQNIYVLSKGILEEYYPIGVGGTDKPSRALNACSLVRTRQDIEQVCPTVISNGREILELEAIFERIFR